MNLKASIQNFGIERVVSYLYSDPKNNLPRVIDILDNLSGDYFKGQFRVVREAATNPNNPYHDFIQRIFTDVDPHVAKTLASNFFINAALASWDKQEKLREKYNCNMPWAILLDPTTACNLNCTGCWAAEYGHQMNLSFDEIDDIIEQGKEIGVYMYIYTGGEPLVRKKDIIKICEKHNDCIFLTFTNGTLIDEKFADDMLRVGNFVPAISLEGFETATDGRRGEGTYQAVIDAIEILHEKKLVYGISACYTSENVDSIVSEEFFDYLIELGVYFIWYFHYMPVGNNAVPELMPNPEQRTKVMERIRRFRVEKPLFAIDFQNDGQYVDGCIAGGRRYLHINANGDMEPCVFIHYSDSNIREKTLLEGLQSPLFMAYHDNQPFNDNMLRPCPMLENPDYLRKMVKDTNAKSTDYESPEPVEHLCAKCDCYAQNWKPVADEIWAEKQREKKEREIRKQA